MPPSASSKRPIRSALASVNAPFTWPNISLSNTPSLSPPRFTVTMGLPVRGELACSHSATSSFPVPCSPVMTTFAPDGPTRSMSRSTGCIAGAVAMISGRPSRRSSRCRSSSRWVVRSARPSSIWVRRVLSSRALSHGFSM